MSNLFHVKEFAEFTLKLLGSTGVDQVVLFCAFVSELWYCIFYELACIFLCTVSYACVDFVISTKHFIFEIFEFLSYHAELLHDNGRLIMWLCPCYIWGVMHMLSLVRIQILEMASIWILLGRVPLVLWALIVSQLFQRHLTSDGSAGGNRTMIIVVSLQIPMLRLSVISLSMFILYHWPGVWNYCIECRFVLRILGCKNSVDWFVWVFKRICLV